MRYLFVLALTACATDPTAVEDLGLPPVVAPLTVYQGLGEEGDLLEITTAEDLRRHGEELAALRLWARRAHARLIELE